MDHKTPAIQTYNAGTIFVSYVIAVVGAMTTLELLQRRTHFRGKYNWFLLLAAAASMGGVGIWSMHFIGNNSLTITLDTGDEHQLSYSTGFTFLSLVVAIITMFLAFVFVGITEEAKLGRIVPSGVIAGFGIVSMHYLGQVAIDFFIMENKIAFIVSAAVIAVCAVTAALFIFFKLREQWANQLYKRLGCAMLMGVAVCGMHYTALVGTVYYPSDSNSGPPTPVLGTAALIGIISAIVVLSCIGLFFVVVKANIENGKLPFQKTSRKRLILDIVFFDSNGRIMVKVDGLVPMKEILDGIPEDAQEEIFSASHPLFVNFFETTVQWSANSKNVYSNLAAYNAANGAFVNAATELVEELRFAKLSDLGHLFDSVLSTNTISTKHKRSLFSQEQPASRRISTTGSWLLSNRSSEEVISEAPYKNKKRGKNGKDRRRSSLISAPDDATVIDIFNHTVNSETNSSVAKNLTVNGSDSEDKHIFLVKKISSNKDLVNLLSIGFRFAEPVFISKTMGEKLQVPSDYILNHFRDMLRMVETPSTMYAPLKPSGYSFYASDSQKKQDDEVRGGIFVGVFGLIDDEEIPNEVPFIIIDKQKRYTFPMVQLAVESDVGPKQKPTELSWQQKNIILGLSGQTLADVSSITSSNDETTNLYGSEAVKRGSLYSKMVSSKSTSLLNVSESLDENKSTNMNASDDQIGTESTQQFLKALQFAAKSLINLSSYGKPLASSALLYGDVLDIPAFSLRPGPCQLILFRAHITTPGTRFAINQTLTESIKCIPFPIYRTFAYYSTDIAVEKYRMEQNKNKSPSSYLTQQRLYQSTAAGQAAKPKAIKSGIVDIHPEDDLEGEEVHSMITYIPAPEGEPVNAAQQHMSSLPPPPRVKRNKFPFPTTIASLDVGYITKNLLPNVSKENTQIPLDPVSHASSSKSRSNLNLLPAGGRFWWLDTMYEETHNA